jgi:hypothetical protein
MFDRVVAADRTRAVDEKLDSQLLDFWYVIAVQVLHGPRECPVRVTGAELVGFRRIVG